MSRVVNMLKNIANWHEYLWYKTFSGNQKGFTFKTRAGLDIRVPKRLIQTFKECFYDESYLKEIPSKYFTNSKPVVIDIGANVGFFSLFMFTKFPDASVFAFEPIPKNYDQLKWYKEKFPELNFTTINKAVSDKDGMLTLNYDANDSFTTSATIFDKAGENDHLEVPTVTLASVMDKYKINTIDFLKLDCEGAEYPILYGTPAEVLEKITAMAIETHVGNNNNENIDSLAQYLQKSGFTVKTDKEEGSGFIWAWK